MSSVTSTLDASPLAAVLFARRDSVYKTLGNLDVYDADRDARNYTGNLPVIAHPPCRGWGRLRHFARPSEGEKDLALFAVDQVRLNGGVLEHPAHSSLWEAAGLPLPRQTDQWGGWTYPIHQFQFGHRAQKNTWLYICGITANRLPSVPFVLGEAPCVVQTRNRVNPRPSITKAEREHTPIDLALWLLQIALLINPRSTYQQLLEDIECSPSPHA